MCHAHYLKLPQETRAEYVQSESGSKARAAAHEKLMEFFVTKRVACKHLKFFKDGCELCVRK